MTRLSVVEANLAAEVRAVENGRRAVWAGDAVRVASDSTPGAHWIVTASAFGVGGGIAFRCRPEEGGTRGHGDRTAVPGRTPCMHSSLLARKMERVGLAKWEGGVWVATDKAPRPAAATSVDPFKGLPVY